MSNNTNPLVASWLGDDLRVVTSPWSELWATEAPAREGEWTPALDLSNAGDKLIAAMDLPGVDRDTIDITVEDGTLVIKASSKKNDVEGQELICGERARGSFSRSIELGTDVDANRVEATYTDGVLEIVLPKAESVKPHKINVTAK